MLEPGLGCAEITTLPGNGQDGAIDSVDRLPGTLHVGHRNPWQIQGVATCPHVTNIDGDAIVGCIFRAKLKHTANPLFHSERALVKADVGVAIGTLRGENTPRIAEEKSFGLNLNLVETDVECG